MNTLMIRERNTDKVINCFLNQEILTQSEIAYSSQLSIPSVGKILRELLEFELINEVEIGESSGGRKPKRYSLDEKKWSVGIIYIEKYESSLYVLTPFNKELFKIHEKKEINDNQSFQEIISTLLKRAESQLSFFSDITSWGIVVPGIVDLENNTIVYSKPLGVIDYKIDPVIDNKENKIFVYLFKDADAYLLSNLSEETDARIAYVYVNDGVGFSMIKDNQLLKNTVGSLEIGHTIFSNKQGELTKLGDVFNKRRLSNLLNLSSEEVKNFSLNDLKQLSEKNTDSLEIFNEQEQALKILMTNVLNLFNPSIVFLSGKYINGFDLGNLIASLDDSILEPFIKNIKIEHTKSDTYKALKGVVRYINKKIVE